MQALKSKAKATSFVSLQILCITGTKPRKQLDTKKSPMLLVPYFSIRPQTLGTTALLIVVPCLLARVETKHGLLGGFEYSLGWRFGRQPWNRCLQDGPTPSEHQSENRARSLGDKVGNRVGHVTVAQSSGCLRDRGWLLNLLLPLTLWFAAIFLLRSSSFRAVHPPATLASSSTPSLPARLHGLPLALSRRMCSRVECATARTCDLPNPLPPKPCFYSCLPSARIWEKRQQRVPGSRVAAAWREAWQASGGDRRLEP